ncbi:CehA/McbA family metallohydrolase [Myxococcota bacterium]|nr:CehA/McbA family metallohydrolase [Myxococcota bacterium]
MRCGNRLLRIGTALWIGAALGCSVESATDLSPADVPGRDLWTPDVPGDSPEDPGRDESPTDLPEVSQPDPGTPDEAGEADAPACVPGARGIVAASQEDLVGGPTASGVPGDVVLQNSRVRFVVRNQQRSLYSPYGGALVDADLVRPEGTSGEDRFLELFPMIGFGRIFRPATMRIVDDGSCSGQAVVRFEGGDGGMALIDSILPTFSSGARSAVEYRLGPEDTALEIRVILENPSAGEVAADVGIVMQMGKRLEPFHVDCGPDQKCLSGKSGIRWLAGSDLPVSYALAPEGATSFSLLLAEEDMLLLTTGTAVLQEGDTVTRTFRLDVGAGSVDDLRSRLMTWRGEDPGIPFPVSLRRQDPFTDFREVRVQVRRAGVGSGGFVTEARPDSQGNCAVTLPAGTYDFRVLVPGAADAWFQGIEVPGEPAETPLALDLPPAGRLRIRVTGPEDRPVTAAATLQAGRGADWNAGGVQYDPIPRGDRQVPVVPGDYTLTVARGLTWTADRQDVTVRPGEVTEATARIAPAVDTAGFLSVNTHEHCERSIDSFVPVEDRVWNAVANGIDVMNPTDHDFFGNHRGTIARLGIQDQVISYTGCEVSPLWGHTTAAGCLAPPAYDTYFAVAYTLYDDDGNAVRPTTPVEVYRQAREGFQCEFLAVNHPYRGGATFESYGITASSDPAAALPDLDLRMVDAVEVYNKFDDVETVLDQNLPAWFNLLNRGYAIAGIGGSDSHTYDGNYGNPRNLVPVESPVSETLPQGEVFSAIKAFRSQVLGGPVVDLQAGGGSLGDVVAAVGGVVPVRIRVMAPPWMGLQFVRLFVNGEVARDFAPLESGEVLRLDEEFELATPTDAHLVVVAGSTLAAHRMTPISGKFPMTITNPVFVDADGDGYKAIHHDGAPWDPNVQ